MAKESFRRQFLKGLLSGLGWGIGTTIGLALFLVLFSWILKFLGGLPFMGNLLAGLILATQEALQTAR